VVARILAIPLIDRDCFCGEANQEFGIRSGLSVGIVAWDHDKYIGNFYDVARHLIVRVWWGLATELRQHRIATVALAPGFMRAERVMSHTNGEADWKKIAIELRGVDEVSVHCLEPFRAELHA
jgi:NAD(P)-dependent dehydrogenase (short-subunit alcohol dehydrogenase family)